MTIYFPAAGKRVAASDIYNISKYNRYDQFALIYIRTEGSYWSLMPYTTEGGSRYYNSVDCGYVKFFADAGEGMQWTNNFNVDVKIIIINETERTSLYAKGVDFSSHDEVVAAIGDDRKVSQAF